MFWGENAHVYTVCVWSCFCSLLLRLRNESCYGCLPLARPFEAGRPRLGGGCHQSRPPALRASSSLKRRQQGQVHIIPSTHSAPVFLMSMTLFYGWFTSPPALSLPSATRDYPTTQSHTASCCWCACPRVHIGSEMRDRPTNNWRKVCC